VVSGREPSDVSCEMKRTVQFGPAWLYSVVLLRVYPDDLDYAVPCVPYRYFVLLRLSVVSQRSLPVFMFVHQNELLVTGRTLLSRRVCVLEWGNKTVPSPFSW